MPNKGGKGERLMTARKMISKFPGWCKNCNSRIQKGSSILWTPPANGEKSFAVHENCPEKQNSNPKARISKKVEVKISDTVPSPLQSAIFKTCLDMDDLRNLIIEAVAGSGKTWTITQAVYHIILSGKIQGITALLLAFNRHIAQELAPKFPSDKVTVKTSNGFGFSLLNKVWKDPKIKMNEYKIWDIFSKKCYDLESMEKEEKSHTRKMFWPIKNLVSLAKGHNVQSEGELKKVWRDFADKFTIDIPDENKYPEFESVLLQCYGFSIADKQVIDYDDMLFFPVLYRDEMIFPVFPFVFVDEAQDLNPVQIEMLKILNEKGSRIICVGDTHQAIYGFRGADPYSMKNIKEALDCKPMPLSINYRCPRVVIDYAKELVPHIEACDSAPLGEILEDNIKNLIKITQDNDYILCRTMAPLVQSCLRFVAMGRKAKVLGRNIGKDMENLIQRISNGHGDKLDIDSFLDLLQEWADQEIEKVTKKNPPNIETKIVIINDRAETIRALATNAKIVSDLYTIIRDIFSDDSESGIVLSTIHRCKGLENDRVIIICPELLPHPMAKQPWEREQELNLEYVAVTRAKETLIILNGKMEELTEAA
jgi:superfamily I DNA/RNA helicase